MRAWWRSFRHLGWSRHLTRLDRGGLARHDRRLARSDRSLARSGPGTSPGVTGAYEGLPLRIVTRRCAAAVVQF